MPNEHTIMFNVSLQIYINVYINPNQIASTCICDCAFKSPDAQITMSRRAESLSCENLTYGSDLAGLCMLWYYYSEMFSSSGQKPLTQLS